MTEKIGINIKFQWPQVTMSHLEQLCQAAHDRNYESLIPLHDNAQKMLLIGQVSPDEIVHITQCFPVEAIVAGEIARPFCAEQGWFGIVEYQAPPDIGA